jgi:hypothetical protein
MFLRCRLILSGGSLEQNRHLPLGEPNRFPLQPHVQLDGTIRRLIKDNLATAVYRPLGHHYPGFCLNKNLWVFSDLSISRCPTER